MLLRPRQRVFVERSLRALDEHSQTLGVAPTGCHAPGTPILMFDGSIRRVENVRPGEVLMGSDSRPRWVIQLHRGDDDMYEIRPIKGDPFVVNGDHVLSLVRTNAGKPWSHPGTIVDLTLRDYLRASPTFRHLHKLYRTAVDFPARLAPRLDPHFLGILLGDGCWKYGTPAVTTPDPEIAAHCQDMADRLGLRLRIEQLAGNEANTYFFAGSLGAPNVLKDELRRLALQGCASATKFIPDNFKLGSNEVRRQVLAGLIDTDGHVHNKSAEVVSKSERLASDIAFVARSLGFLALVKRKIVNGAAYHRVAIVGELATLPMLVARKQAPARLQKKDPLRTGFTVHPVGPGRFCGFTVDGDHRYLLGDFTVTHNSGKTIMLSSVLGQTLADGDAKACVLAHRDELTAQNEDKFRRVNPAISTSVVDARSKSWAGRTVFAMVPTLARSSNLESMPALDLLVIDEAHHAAADTYLRIIDRAHQRNPDLKLYGVTATPNRGDKRGLRPLFSNVADQIRVGELIATGHLVPPRTFVVDVGVQSELARVERKADDFDMAAVNAIMNRAPITDQVIQHWQEKAGDRQTVVFCSTVDHASNVHARFVEAGVRAVLVTGEMATADRRAALAAYAGGEAQVIVNVAVLTEGWDHPPTSCVVLLRPSSFKCTMIQMIGRGLRTVDPNEYPGVVKTDCIVLDFGTSSLLHGSLEQGVDLDGRTRDELGDAPTKTCPDCDAEVPLAVDECPLCGHGFGSEAAGDAFLDQFVMTELDLLQRSNFRWVDLFGDDAAMMANGFDAWAGIFCLNGRWHAVGGTKGAAARLLGIGERLVSIAAADDWLNEHETDVSAHKSRRWLDQVPTEKQLAHLPPEYRQDLSLTRYEASALLTFRFNRGHIRRLVFDAADGTMGRAA